MKRAFVRFFRKISTSMWHKVALCVLLAAVIAVSVAAPIVAKNKRSEPATVQTHTDCTHEFENAESEYNLAADYFNSGRQLQKCIKCGETKLVSLPKLQKLPTNEDEQYSALLPAYTVQYGSTLAETAESFFTEGWTFDEDGATSVGAVSAEGYVFNVKYTPSSEAYAEQASTVRLIVAKRALTAEDVLIDYDLEISTSDDLYSEVRLELRSVQEIAGTVAWRAGQSIVRGRQDLFYVFTPTDTQNYESFTGSVEVLAVDD